MEVVAEFVLDRIQYQEVSNGSWNAPMSGHRRRTLDSEGNAISGWDYITYDEYQLANGRYSETLNQHNNQEELDMYRLKEKELQLKKGELEKQLFDIEQELVDVTVEIIWREKEINQ